MTSDVTITPPAEGKVVLELDWKDAEILARIVGLTNSGNLDEQSPALATFVETMTEHVGRNNHREAKNYFAHIHAGQAYVGLNPPF